MDLAGNWGSPVVVSRGGQHAKMPSLAVNGDRWAISWQRADDYTFRAEASIYSPDNQSWSVPVSLSPEGKMGIWSELSAHGPVGFTAVWSHSDGGGYHLKTTEAA